MGSRIDISFRPFWEWEEYKNGMYSMREIDEKIVDQCVWLLSDCSKFRDVIIQIIEDWNVTMYYHMNGSFNKKAFLGQTACNFMFKATDREVREAWSKMEDRKRNEANLVASKFIKSYEAKNKKIHNQLEIQGL